MTPPVQAVYRRARALAEEGCEDRGAVDELRGLAGPDRDALLQAELLARIGGRYRESALENRRHRLVVAALTDRDVEPPTSEDLARFQALGEFEALTLESQWQQLSGAEPRLKQVEADARTGAFNHGNPHGENVSDARELKAENARRWFALHERIKPLVGPASDHNDPLLTSRAARDSAFSYLQHPDRPDHAE